uniref:NADH dehydrogenase subunit 6 n=1 Tax=Parasagitta elegans TaxID=1562708 RepID=A0A141CL45_9BILA|nr:NADH dehydrogenase subunit 6 [Parasagitta elegans]
MLLVGFSMLLISSPFIVALLFVVILFLGSLVAGTVDSFLGLVIFVVYVGGALVLFSYCFMLSPLQDSSTSFTIWALPTLCLTIGGPTVDRSSLYEFYWVSSLLVSVGVLLFVVMVCVVALIDLSEGAMRVS